MFQTTNQVYCATLLADSISEAFEQWQSTCKVGCESLLVNGDFRMSMVSQNDRQFKEVSKIIHLFSGCSMT